MKPVYFKSYKEDKEHIYPGTPKDIKTISSLIEPAQNFSKYIVELNDGFNEDKLINWNFIQEEWEKYSPEQKNEKLKALKMEIHEKRPINSIGNLVLLHLRINRGFGNNYYTDKRITVIENTQDGEYVRAHTLKVFVKQTDNKDLNQWTMADITRNADSIHDLLRDFFQPIKPN
jgi:hypothetical protein